MPTAESLGRDARDLYVASDFSTRYVRRKRVFVTAFPVQFDVYVPPDIRLLYVSTYANDEKSRR